MKIKITTEWSLKQIVKRFSEAEEYQQICLMERPALTVGEGGGIAIKSIKTRIGAP